MYDLLIKGGRVIDPSQDLDGDLDVAISGDRIAAIAGDIPPSQGREMIDARGKMVTPGIIDLHCHVAGSLLTMSIDPDTAGVLQGVTTVVDGGSAGEAIFGGFPTSRTRVFCFLHIGSQGLSIMPELRDWNEINLEATARAIESHRGLIKGVKLRLVGDTVARDGLKVVETAKAMAGQFGLPLMIHIGDLKQQVSPTLTQEVLPLLESGDILSHVYTAKFGSALRSDGTLLPELREAMERGVVLDTALGGNNFSFEVARKCMAQGILPTTLSTDLAGNNLRHPVYGMTVTMTKFMALGLDLKAIIEMSTVNPARAIGEEKRIGSLRPDMAADASVLEFLPGKWKLEDSEQQTIATDRLIAPSVTVSAGRVIPAQPAAQPQSLV
jgi:dihydroorotase